jgi:nucleoid-associated protein YgaU
MKRSIVLVALLVCTIGGVSAQSLMSDPRYRELVEEADERAAAAREAIEEGRYDDALELSREAEKLTEEAEEYAEVRVLRFRAHAFRNRADDRVAVVRRLKADERYPEAWQSALSFFEEGNAAYDAERWEESIDAYRAVMTALEPVEPVPFSPTPRPPAPTVAARTDEGDPESPRRPPMLHIIPGHPPVALDPGRVTSGLPALYRVRLICHRRDSFWRIAEYPFVYGDPWKWPILYRANREKLQDPANPHLIQPGMLFEIPELGDEEREGVWVPD